MDVHCTTCGEPWESYHLRHDAIWETGLSEDEITAWNSLPTVQRLEERYRLAFKTVGYEFGQSVLTVIRCPGCPANARPDAAQFRLKAELEELLANDEDGLASTYEELNL